MVHLPSREDVVQFISDNPGSNGKREIAKAFGLKSEGRIWLKNLLRSLADDGVIEKRRKTIHSKGSLPPVAVLDIFGRDKDGSLLGRPVDWHDDEPPIVLLRAGKVAGGPAIGVGDRITAKVFPSKEKGPAYTGRLIRKVDKKNSTVLGVLREIKGEWRLEPVDRKQDPILIDPQSLENAKENDLVEVTLGRDSRYGLKRGMVRQVVGSIESEKALSMIAIYAHSIPHIFPEEVLQESENVKPVVMADCKDGAGREDWRDIPFVTIDPHDAKDHDDAVYAEPDSNEANAHGHIVMVAIADVSAYIRPNSAMDREALKRGNSVYFPDRVVPMLPERISNNLCSLREGEERPAMGVRMVYNKDGHKLSHSFHRVMIRSHAKLSYQQAEKAIDGVLDEKTAPIIDTILKPLWKAYDSLKKARDKREPLDLDLPEKKLLLDEEGRVKDVYIPLRLDAHRLIEECMIAANVAAAETLKSKGQSLIFRIHDQPSLAKQESLREFLATIGLPLARGADLTPSKFNAILSKVKGSEQQDLVNQVVLRSQAQAEYSPDNIGHFGLTLHNYAHFTSPIRRYADLIVHRALIKALKLGNDGLTDREEEQLGEISAQISQTERRAMAAERETTDRLIAHYFADKINAEFSGRITGVTKSGLFVQLDPYGADGFIPISTLGAEYYLYDEARHALVGERSQKGFQMGDVVSVRLVEALPVAGALRFEMLTKPQELPFSMLSHHKTGKRNRNMAQKPQRGRRRR
ncbi:ribonuclease R [Bartonella sp. HY761]|uniref:ribonuclease R n=1 Tax=Bartonella sp. HY761 TaxID=2979330 RepID=UPI0021FCAEC7|nr:ribonuclease R [Bartonella sp. HY761]UXN07807.1 ribonuclease R [Bartonella sp. HY761]